MSLLEENKHLVVSLRHGFMYLEGVLSDKSELINIIEGMMMNIEELRV